MYFVIASILFALPLFSSDCVKIKKELKPQFDRLVQLIAIENANKAYFLADSLSSLIKKQNNQYCPLSLWIGYYQGESFELRKEFEKALLLYYNIIKIAEQQHEWEIAAQCYISVARCHEYLNRNKDCLRNLQIAKAIIDKYNLQQIEPIFAYRYSSYQRIFGSKDSAEVYAWHAVDLGNKEGILRAQTDGYLLLGILSENLESSCNHYRKAASLFYNNKNHLGAAVMYQNISRKYWLAKMPEKAKAAADTSLIFSNLIAEKNKGYFSLVSRITAFKSEYFEYKNKIDTAYFYLKQSNDFFKKSESIINQEKIESDAIAFAILKEREKVINAEHNSFMLILGLGAMSILLLVLTYVVYNNQKKRTQIAQQNITISTNNDALNQSLLKQSILLSEVHHRVKNNLQLVISLLALHGHNTKNSSVKTYLDDLSRKVFSIALIHEQLYRSGDFEKIDTKEYIQELTSNFQILQDDNKQITFDTDVDQIMLNLETVLPLGIICSELISNSLKYAQNDDAKIKINISLKFVQNKYLLIFKDNGPGLQHDLAIKTKQGMGLTLIGNMVRQLQGESSRYNDAGAVFTLLFEEKTVSLV